MSTRSELIAPGKTKNDWVNLAKQLLPGGDEAFWAAAFDNFLLARLRRRYLEPIAMIRDRGE